MQNTLKYFFVLLLILFQPGIETAHAAKPIIPAIVKIHKHKKEDLPKTNKLAKWSLILTGSGFLSALIPYLAMLSPYLIAGGIVCGIIALSQIKKNKEKGKGLAIASLVVGGVTVLVAIVAVAVLLSIFN
jgi:4-hydroxybenzoate polyprenyltransferase